MINLRKNYNFTKKQKIAISVMIAAGIMVSVAANQYHMAASLKDTVASPSDAETFAAAEEAETSGARFSRIHSSLADIEDDEDESDFTALPTKLNLAYFYADGADTSDVINSYAGTEYKKLMTEDSQYIAAIYDLAGQSPSAMAGKLGVSQSRVLGKYNPNASGQSVTDSSSWLIPTFKNVNIAFYDADGKRVNEYSNVKDIMSMASVYTYYTKGYMDVDTFDAYCDELYKKSRSYSVSIGKVYYCDGCINKSAEEEAKEASALEQQQTNLLKSLENATAVSEGILNLTPENEIALDGSASETSAVSAAKSSEAVTSADASGSGKNGIVSGNADVTSAAGSSAAASSAAAPATAPTTAAPTAAPTTAAPTTAAQTAAPTSAAASSNGNDVLILGQNTAYVQNSGTQQNKKYIAKLTAETDNYLVLDGNAQTAAVQSEAQTSSAGTKEPQSSSQQQTAAANAGTSAGNLQTNTSEEQAAVSDSSSTAAGPNGSELPLSASGTAESAGTSADASAEESAAESTEESKEKNYCPGHVDLYVNVTLYGFDDQKGLRTVSLKSVDAGNTDKTKSGTTKSAESGKSGKTAETAAAASLNESTSTEGESGAGGTEEWNGWTEELIKEVQELISQDWFKRYGLSISSINPKNPLTQEEISSYLDRLPADTSEERKEIVQYALNSVGKIPYYWGGKASSPGYEKNSFGTITGSPDYKGRILRGLDCSGWVQWVYWSALGKSLGGASSTSSLIGSGVKINRADLQPGDIIVRVGADSHVVMFLEWVGNGNMIAIHENSSSNNVSVEEVTANYPYYRRLIQ